MPAGRSHLLVSGPPRIQAHDAPRCAAGSTGA